MVENNFCFLVGSGVSLHAGMPSTQELSNQILTGDNIVRHTSGCYHFTNKSQLEYTIPSIDPKSAVNSVLLLLSQIKAEADVYYRGGLQSNYEDWYYLADQLATAQGDFDNPALWAFLEHLRPRVEVMQPLAKSTERVEQRSQELCRYISDVVILRLLKIADQISLDWIVDAVRDTTLSCHGVFTLNHDRVLETLFERNKVEYTVGFERVVEGSAMRQWDGSVLFDPGKKVILAKLHGSVDWRQKNNLGRFLKDSEKVLEASRRLDKDQAPDTEPMLLIGRHNKLYHYNNFLFEDLHYRFYLSLKASSILIVCGYGFGDKGINSRIINWRFSNRSNRLVIVREKLPFDSNARLAIIQNLADWRNDSSIVHIDKNAETVTWPEIRAALAERFSA